jgi:hypothetical protein
MKRVILFFVAMAALIWVVGVVHAQSRQFTVAEWHTRQNTNGRFTLVKKRVTGTPLAFSYRCVRSDNAIADQAPVAVTVSVDTVTGYGISFGTNIIIVPGAVGAQTNRNRLVSRPYMWGDRVRINVGHPLDTNAVYGVDFDAWLLLGTTP